MANDILVKVGADISDYSRKMSESSRSLSGFTKANQQTFDAFKKTGAVVTGAGVALAGGLGVAVNEAIKFEDSFAGVRKTVDASEAEFAELAQGFRDLSKEIPLSVNEINAIGESAGQLGIEKKHILSFTRTMADLGVATNMSSEEAATALARLANITQMPQSEFDRLGSTVVALGNNLATTESEIVEMGLRLAGAGKQVGMTEAEILSFSGALSSVGIEAEAGGSAFSKVMVQMQLAAEKGGKELDNFAKVAGMSADEFKVAFEQDASGAIIEFVKGLSTAEERGLSAIGILDEMGITETRMRDALLRAAGASDVFTESLEIGRDAWEENTALTKEAEERYKTMKSQLQLLKNSVIDAAISLGEALMPAVQKVVEWITKLIEWFNGLSDNTKTFIAVGAAVASVLMVVGGGLLLLIGFIPNIISGFSAIASVIRTVRKAMVVLNTAFLTNPIVLVIGLIIAAVVGLAYLIYKYWDEIKAFTIKVWKAVVNFLSGLWDRVKKNWEIFKKWISDFWTSIKDTAQAIWEGIVNAVMAIVQPFIDGFMNIWDGMKDGIFDIFEGIKMYFEGIWDIIKNIFLGAVLLLINLVTGNFEELKKNAMAIWDNIKDAFGKIWDGIKLIFEGALDAIWGFIKGAWDNIKTNTKAAFKWVSDTISSIWDGIKRFFTETLSNIWTTIKNKFTDIVNSARDKMNEAKQKIEDAWNNAVKFLKDIDLKQIGKDIIDGLINGIKDKVTAVGNAVKDVTSQITGKIKDILKISSPSRVLAQIGRWIGEGLEDGITQSQRLVERATEKLAEAATPDMRTISMDYATPSGSYASLASAVSGTVDVRTRDDMIATAISRLERKLTNLEVVMDERIVGRIVEPHVTEQQDRNKRVINRFRG